MALAWRLSRADPTSAGAVSIECGIDKGKTHEDILNTGLDAEINGAPTASTQSANNEDSGKTTSLGLAFCNRLLDIVDEKLLVVVGRHTREGFVLPVHELP